MSAEQDMQTDQPKDDLLPCPFCGWKKMRADWQVALVDSGNYAVWCPDCFAEGPAEETEAKAIALWNTRSPAHAGMKEALEWALRAIGEFYAFCDDPKRPCGEYGVECPISMGEWVSKAEREALEVARARLRAEGK